jgi:hypothetical protein
MSTIDKIVTIGTVLLGSAGLLGCADSTKSESEYEKGIKISQTSTNPEELEKYAQEHMNGPTKPAKFAYFRALYFNNLQIVENNNKLLQEKGLNIDLSDQLTKAKELQTCAQQEQRYGPSHSAMFKYLEAISLTDNVIMQQQETLMEK